MKLLVKKERNTVRLPARGRDGEKTTKTKEKECYLRYIDSTITFSGFLQSSLQLYITQLFGNWGKVIRHGRKGRERPIP